MARGGLVPDPPVKQLGGPGPAPGAHNLLHFRSSSQPDALQVIPHGDVRLLSPLSSLLSSLLPPLSNLLSLISHLFSPLLLGPPTNTLLHTSLPALSPHSRLTTCLESLTRGSQPISPALEARHLSSLIISLEALNLSSPITRGSQTVYSRFPTCLPRTRGSQPVYSLRRLSSSSPPPPGSSSISFFISCLGFGLQVYRGTSHVRKRPPLRAYSRTTPRALWGP